MEKKIKYEDALLQLENIIHQLENNELDVDNIASQLKSAQKLIKLCKERLASVDAEIRELLEDSNMQ